MGIMMDYVVPAIVGAVSSIFLDKFVVPHIKVTLCSGQMLESLEEMANAVTENSLQPEQSPIPTAIDEWYEELRCLVQRAYEMVHRYRQVRRIQDRLNVFSHHQRSKNITNLISDIDRYLKLAPLIQLDLVLWQMVKKIRPPPPPPPSRVELHGAFYLGDAGLVGWAITAVFQRLRNFKKSLESFEDLVKKIDPIIKESEKEIYQIQLAHNDASNRVDNASKWLVRMNEFLTEAHKILNQSPSSLRGSPIGCYRKSKKMTELTSKIYAHLNKLSLINLDLLIHETEGSTSHPPWPQQGDNGVSSDCDGPPWHNNGVC